MARSRWLYGLLATVLVSSLVTGLPGAPSISVANAASTFVVDTTDDVVGDCDVEGECSLRAAVTAANAESGATVSVPAGTDSLTRGQLRLTRPMSIQGAASTPGPTATTIDAGGSSRVFDVASQGVSISGVVITGGDVRANKKNDSTGGGIRVGRGSALTLVDSTVTGNKAVDGGGLSNLGTVEVRSSTFASNEATGKGGAIENAGTGLVENTTLTLNTASQGGALNSPGSTDVLHSTIVRNVAGSSSSGGVDRNGGTLNVTYSIIANNLRSNGAEASDCSGTPDLLVLNLVSDTQGCNPVGDVIEGDPVIGALTNNGGPTETVALLDGSPAIDAITGSCAVDTDQRGTARPTGEGCDLGAYEVAPLAATFSLDVDTSNYAPLEAGTVEVGAVSVPLNLIQDELVSQGEASTDGPADTALRSIALRSIPLRSIDLESTPLRSIPLRSIGLEAIALRSIPLRSIDLEAAPLRSILLSEIPLLSIDGGWQAFLAGTVFAGLPLQSVTLEDLNQAGVDLGELTLADIGLEASPLRSIALRSILLADAPLRSIPLSDDLASADDDARIAAWCEVLGDICGDTPGTISAADLGELDLLSAQLAGVSVEDVPVFDIPLTSLASTPLRSIPLRSIPLRSIEIANTPLRSIPLRSIALRSIGDLELLVDCSLATGNPDYCSPDPANEITLGDAIAAGDLLDAELGVLVDSLAAVAIG
jgi:CSLREA domain-containing protein